MDTQDFTEGESKEPGNKGNLNLWQRISGVLWGGPVKTFEDIVGRPGVAAITVLLLAVNFILFLPTIPKVKEFTLWSLQNNPQTASLPAQAVSAATTWAVVVVLVASVLMPLVMWLIMALLLKLFNAFSGENAPFKTLFAVTAYAYLPVLLASVIHTVLVVLSPAQNMHRVNTSLALLLPGDKIDRLYMTLAQIDPFFIWGLVLLTAGGSVAMKVPAVKVGMYVAVLWVLYVLGMGLLSPLPPAGM
ncbi:hypothetical protein DCCM_2101 [Desulfocucumis palustris]|uniref:Yip1 domain-containing protein n=1 Tax=Desulfocucumis palustris TaxID=1898651 RepID=A0A2L2XAK7_9FIRM|nr:Yip1 family protein [Desulfocucumis palustris]GBF33004.1 hypothetical protein DCCM_2101 [Desulfocucumis palustris]